jgi:hypothetical protein
MLSRGATNAAQHLRRGGLSNLKNMTPAPPDVDGGDRIELARQWVNRIGASGVLLLLMIRVPDAASYRPRRPKP